MKRLPLLFTFKDKVLGNGFLAEVICKGRLLVEFEEDGVWMYGVQPGGLAASGEDVGEAYLKFRNTFKAILFDMAENSETYDEFRDNVRKFFHEVSEPTLLQWKDAVKEVKKRKIKVQNLRSEPAESQRSIRVDLLFSVGQENMARNLSAHKNTMDLEPAIAA